MEKVIRTANLSQIDYRTFAEFERHGWMSTQAWKFDEGDAICWVDGTGASWCAIRVEDSIASLKIMGLRSAMAFMGIDLSQYSKVVW